MHLKIITKKISFSLDQMGMGWKRHNSVGKRNCQ